MAISVNWATKVIYVPKADMSLVQSSPFEVRELDIDVFRLALKDLEDDVEGMPFLDTHRHSTTVTIGGTTLARVVEIINDYTVTFEDGQYAVNLVGANSNISDVLNLNQVSVRSANSAGLIVVTQGSGVTPGDVQDIADAVWDEAKSEHVSAGSFGELVGGLETTISGIDSNLINVQTTVDLIKTTVDGVEVTLSGVAADVSLIKDAHWNKKVLTQLSETQYKEELYNDAGSVVIRTHTITSAPPIETRELI